MAEPEAHFRLLSGTRAAQGVSGGITLIADRPEGRAGGAGQGLNGGQVLALSLGTCFSNDLQYAADEMGLAIADFALDIFIDFGGEPRIAERIAMEVTVELAGGGDPAALIANARQRCVIANTLKAGTQVTIEQAA